VFTLKPRDF